MVVGLALAVVAEEVVEALLQRVALRAGRAEAPLAGGRGDVAAGLQPLGDRDGGRRQRPLALRLHLLVVADRRVPGVQARHQHAARRRADRVARVVPREAHALGGQAVDRGRADLLLAVGSDVSVAQVVGEDEDDVGRDGGRRRSRRTGARAGAGEEEGEEESGSGHGAILLSGSNGVRRPLEACREIGGARRAGRRASWLAPKTTGTGQSAPAVDSPADAERQLREERLRPTICPRRVFRTSRTCFGSPRCTRRAWPCDAGTAQVCGRATVQA